MAVLACCCNDDEDDANAVLCVQSVSILMADGVCSTGEGASCETGVLENTSEKDESKNTYDKNELVNACEKDELENTCEKGELANT